MACVGTQRGPGTVRGLSYSGPMPQGFHLCEVPGCGLQHMNIHTHEQGVAHARRTGTYPAFRDVPVYRTGKQREGFKPYGDRLTTLTSNGGNTFFQRRDQ